MTHKDRIKPLKADALHTGEAFVSERYSEAEWVRGVLRSAEDRGAFYSVIALSAAGTVLPELLDFFEHDGRKCLAFIERFAGVTVQFPTRMEVLAMTRRIAIMQEVLVHRRTYREIGNKYAISPHAARETFQAALRVLVAEKVLTPKSSAELENEAAPAAQDGPL
mgnify:CR=1 FL=1